jgi:hypothetical protein
MQKLTRAWMCVCVCVRARASRVGARQAIARDNIFPISFFKQGARKGDEPQFAVILTFLLAQTIIYLPTGPSVNAIGGILTDFFLTACKYPEGRVDARIRIGP